MKGKWKKVVSLMLSACVLAGCMAGCGKKVSRGDELLYYIMGSEGKDMSWVLNEVNTIVKEKTGVTLNFQFLTEDNYDLVLSSGEAYDLIFAPDWMNYWENAAKGAFAEISDEDLQKNAPYIWENGQNPLQASIYKGIRYGIPNIHEYAADRCLAARGDLMKKYNIADLNSKENVEAYLTAVAENEPEMIPFDLPGNQSYLLLAMFAPDWGWVPVGSLSFGEQVYFRKDDPEHKLFLAAEQPEMLEFTETMKRWNDKGFFSKSVLSNKTQSADSFKSGRSALAFVNTPSDCQIMWDELKADDRAGWDVKFYSRYEKQQQMYGYNNNIVAISAFSNNKDTALQVLDAMYSSKEVVRLLNYGIEGTHYEVTADDKIKILDSEAFGWTNTGIVNKVFMMEPALDFPGCDELVQKLKDMRFYNAAVNCPISDEGIREIKLALTEVYDQYTAPRYYGIITGTPEEAIKKELEALKTAGVDQFKQSIQSQLDEYMKGIQK